MGKLWFLFPLCIFASFVLAIMLLGKCMGTTNTEKTAGMLSQCLELCEGELMCRRLRLYVCRCRNVACTLYDVT